MVIINIIILLLLINSILIFKRKIGIIGCGLIGFNGSANFSIHKIQALMLANITRGKHSTGIYNDGKLIKEAVDAIDFLAKYKLHEERVFIGHDRFATIGVKTAKNAHPFEYGNTVLAHNGTLTNHWKLLREANLEYVDYDVDSQVIAKLISLQGESYNVLREFEGAAALIWTDKGDPNRLYCFRNSERPLFHGVCEEGMYISSIENSLKVIGCKNITSFKTNYVYSIVNGRIDLAKSKQIVRKKVKVKTYGSLPSHTATDDTHEYKPSWVKIVLPNSLGLVVNDYYERRQGTTSYTNSLYKNDVFIRSISDYELIRISDDIDEIVDGDFLIAMESSDNKLIQKGEMYNVTHLYLKVEKEYVTVNHLLSGKTYTWMLKYFRPATTDEVDDFFEKEYGSKNDDDQLTPETIDKENLLIEFKNRLLSIKADLISVSNDSEFLINQIDTSIDTTMDINQIETEYMDVQEGVKELLLSIDLLQTTIS